MLTPGNSNLAYDFSLFDTEEFEKRSIEKKKTKKNVSVIKNSIAKRGNMFKIIILAVCIAAVPIYYLASRVTLSELSVLIGTETELLEKAQAENLRLQTELDNMVTLSKVEEYAKNELQLQKITSSQEKHIELNTESITEIADYDTGNPFLIIRGWFNGIMEYLGF